MSVKTLGIGVIFNIGQYGTLGMIKDVTNTNP